jgi:hypothetical protein
MTGSMVNVVFLYCLVFVVYLLLRGLYYATARTPNFRYHPGNCLEELRKTRRLPITCEHMKVTP